MKFKSYLVVVPMAFALFACSQSSDSTGSGQSNSASTPTTTTTPTTTVTNPPTTTTNPPTGSSGGFVNSSSCPQYPSRSYYEYYKSGAGSATATTPAEIVADQKLRVSIEPGSAGSTTTAGGSQSYGALAVNVSLLKNGVVVSSKMVPTQSGGYKTGLYVGEKSDPSLLDFSPYLSGNATYSIQVSNVQTDWTCNNYCNAAHYCDSNYIDCYYEGISPTYDTSSGDWFCCSPSADQMIQQCQNLQCGVGPAQSNQTWSLYIRVETDSTSCVPQ